MFDVIVIGLDPSSTAREASGEGFDLAKSAGAHVHLVTAFSDSARGGLEISAERRSAEAMLESAASLFDGTGQRVTTHALPGKPVDAIIETANRVQADLIVIGNKGTQGARRVLGSIASAVTNEAPCTVMVVKTT